MNISYHFIFAVKVHKKMVIGGVLSLLAFSFFAILLV